MSKNKKTVLALLIVFSLGGVVWALLPPGPDPQMVKVQQLQEKMFDAKTTDEQRRAMFGEMRQEAEKLTEEQRMQLMRENPFAKRMQQTVVAYFDLPPQDRKAALDKDIDRFEKMRKDMEKRRASGDRPPGPPGPPGGGRGNMDAGQRDQFQKRMLDNTSPTERAMFSEYFKDMESRRKERGLPPLGGPGGGRF
jgi:hypothetical protein